MALAGGVIAGFASRLAQGCTSGQALSGGALLLTGTVLRHQQNKTAAILDVRPADYFSGAKSDEARAGHIPAAINRPYTEDVSKADTVMSLRASADLEAAYAKLFPSKDAAIIVHCRTGYQASQTFFILRRLLGYKNVLYYDAGWTEWAARPELPVEK